jgi:glycosidase
MPTAKNRIAAYLPPDVDEKFKAFKEERGIGDSQALILILTEFLKVSQEVNRSSSLDIEALKSELLGELDFRFSELRDELLDKSLKAVNMDCDVIERPTISELSKRFGCDPSLMRKQKNTYKDKPEKFIAWSKSRDPDGRGWKFDEETKLFAPVDG